MGEKIAFHRVIRKQTAYALILPVCYYLLIGDYHPIVVLLLLFLQQQNSLKRTFPCTNATRFATHLIERRTCDVTCNCSIEVATPLIVLNDTARSESQVAQQIAIAQGEASAIFVTKLSRAVAIFYTKRQSFSVSLQFSATKLS